MWGCLGQPLMCSMTQAKVILSFVHSCHRRMLSLHPHSSLCKLVSQAKLMDMFKQEQQGRVKTMAQTCFQPAAFMYLMSLQSLLKDFEVFTKVFDGKMDTCAGLLAPSDETKFLFCFSYQRIYSNKNQFSLAFEY